LEGFSLAEHPQAAAHHQQDSRQDYEDAATAAAHPWAMGALGLKISAAAEQSAGSGTHDMTSTVKRTNLSYVLATAYRSELSTTKQEHNHQDDDHKRHQPTTDVHDKSPFLRLARTHPRSLRLSRNTENKKADVAEHPEVFDHVGLLFNEPPGRAGLLSV
jgi:hypothetical protein